MVRVRARCYRFRVRFYGGEGLDDRRGTRLAYVLGNYLLVMRVLAEKILTLFRLYVACFPIRWKGGG